MDTRFLVDKTASDVQIQLPGMKITLLIKQNNIMNKEKVNIILKIIIRILRVFVKKDKK